MTRNNPNSNERENSEVSADVGSTPTLDDDEESALHNVKGEIPSLISYGDETEGERPQDALLKWFSPEDDTRQESWVSREQAVAMAHVLNAKDKFAHHKYTYHALENAEGLVDDLLNLQVSLDGIGRDQQMRVLGAVMASEREKVRQEADEEDDNGSGVLKSWT